jgi:hypothetical protein
MGMLHFLRFLSIVACWMMAVITHQSRFVAEATGP